MLHDTKSFGSIMKDDAHKPVPALTFKTAAGKPYERFPDVEAEIRAVWYRPPLDWLALKEKIKNETLFFLIKKGGLDDDYIRGNLADEMNKRTVRISESTIKRCDDVLKEEIALEVQAKVFEFAWSDENSAEAEYFEIAFAKKVRGLTLNVIKGYKNSVMTERDQLDVWTEADSEKRGAFEVIELRQDVIDLRRDPEEVQLLILDESRLDELLQAIRDAVKNPKHFLAFYLFYAEEKSLAEIAAQFHTGPREIRYWKDTAMHQIRVALGIDTEEKREALRKLRRARRAKAKETQSRTSIRPSSQPPSISI